LVIKVQLRPNESLEAAMRRFKRQCNYSGIFRLAKAHTWHEKRSDKRRRERRERLRTIQRASRLARQQASGRVMTRKPRRSFSSNSSSSSYERSGPPAA
jgi:small subunit ribosomal protein S21